jgi:dihydropteroate synthase type 2
VAGSEAGHDELRYVLGMIIFGIVNITEDSFSDGGRYLAADAAIAHARKLRADGADVIDLGAAASNPDAKVVSPKEEIARLQPVVAALKSDGTPISIDSFSRETQEWALAQQVDYLNDIHGFPDPSFYPQLARANAQLIVMHSVQESGRATRVDTDPKTIMARVEAFFAGRLGALTAAGVARDRLIVDPGMGLFLGADPEVSLTVLTGLPALKDKFRVRLMVSVSRKGFLRRLTARPVAEIGPATLAAELFAVQKGADIIRTHEPSPLKDALSIWGVLGR